MSGSDLWIPRNETARPSKQNNYVRSPNFNIFLQQIGRLILGIKNRSQLRECGNWEQGIAVSFLGILKSDFQYIAN
jgi:hypothetical protein